MVAQIIQAGRADVVIREDVIESLSDPEPNSFFDQRTGILRVYHGPKYGNSFVSLIPANAEQIGTLISQVNQSACVCKNESSIDLGRKNNDNIPSTEPEMEMEKNEIASSNKNISRDSGGNDSVLNFTQRPQISDPHDEVQNDKNIVNSGFQDNKSIRDSVRTSSIATAYTLIDDPGHANEISKKNFTSNKDDEDNNNDNNDNNDDNNDFTDQFEKLQPPHETTDDKNDDLGQPILSKSQRKKNKKR